MTSNSTSQGKGRQFRVASHDHSGREVTGGSQGEPAVDVHPEDVGTMTIEERLDDLTSRGIVILQEGPRAFLRPVTHRPGALERFLADRDG